MSTFTLEPQYLYKLMSTVRGCTTSKSVNNKCNVPFYTIVVDYLGNCLLCDCDGWLPIPVGKVKDFSSIEEVLSSSTAKMLQEDIAAGNFTWCAVDHCGIRDRNKLKNRVSLSINIDDSCNLQCPSCRRDSIMISSGPEYDFRLQNANRILNWLTNYDQPIHINMSGNGDPLASLIMRPIIKNFYPKPGQTFTLSTNGLLIKKQIVEGLPILDHITLFNISVDAGSKQVYEDVRRPGRWESLLENFDYLDSIGKNKLVSLNFALQNKNYKDVSNFVELCQHYKFRANIHQLDDWGTWSLMPSESPDTWTTQNGIYDDHNVLDPRHLNHNECKEIISQYRNCKNVTISPAILKIFEQQAN